MTSIHMQYGTAAGKRSWTFFELFLLAPFGLLLWYIATEPLVVPEKKMPSPMLATAGAATPAYEHAPVNAIKEQADVMQTTSHASVDELRVVFVTTENTSVLQRIAPVASVNLEVAEPLVAVVADQAPVAVEPSPAQAPQSPATTVPPVTSASRSRIEISDGTGVEGLAKGVAQQLEQAGMSISAFSALTGAQKRTVILYRDGFEDEADRLSKLFARPPVLVNYTKTRKPSDTADVRLVLGSAAAREKALFVQKGGDQKL